MVDIYKIADEAEVILDGFAIIRKPDGRIAIANLNQPGHTTVLLSSGEIDETSMDDIERIIAIEQYEKAKKYMEDVHA